MVMKKQDFIQSMYVFRFSAGDLGGVGRFHGEGRNLVHRQHQELVLQHEVVHSPEDFGAKVFGPRDFGAGKSQPFSMFQTAVSFILPRCSGSRSP